MALLLSTAATIALITRAVPAPEPARPELAPHITPAAPPSAIAPPQDRPVPREASGRYLTAPGADTPRRHRDRPVRYLVEVEQGLPYTPREFARDVHRILADPRGWPAGFHRVDHGPADLRVSLTSPAQARRHCRPLDVGLSLSCWQRGRAVINAARWSRGAPSYAGDLPSYRAYLINHEIGHALGRPHRACPAPGRPAPVMLQQSISLHGCHPNPWPRPREQQE